MNHMIATHGMLSAPSHQGIEQSHWIKGIIQVGISLIFTFPLSPIILVGGWQIIGSL